MAIWILVVKNNRYYAKISLKKNYKATGNNTAVKEKVLLLTFTENCVFLCSMGMGYIAYLLT